MVAVKKDKKVTINVKANGKVRTLFVNPNITQLELTEMLRKMGVFSEKQEGRVELFLKVNNKLSKILPEDYRVKFPKNSTIIVEKK